MGNDSYPVKLTASSTTILGSVFLYALAINKTLSGTVAINQGPSTSVAVFAATTPPNTYHVIPNGARYADLRIGLSTTDDVTAFIRVIQ